MRVFGQRHARGQDLLAHLIARPRGAAHDRRAVHRHQNMPDERGGDAFIKQHCPDERKVPLAGNSIGTDRRFLAHYMPDIENWLHYRSVDVSTIKELVKRWYPHIDKARPIKPGNHRAMDDVRESINELRYYRDSVFADRSPKADSPSE